MANPKFIIITTINSPNKVIKEIADGSLRTSMKFIAIGDTKSPANFQVDGCDFYDVDSQIKSGLRFAEKCPTRHYARKNIGYLLAMRDGAELIVETDDDNIPLPSFWEERSRTVRAAGLGGTGWTNVYRYFTDAMIWPRGLPLDEVRKAPPALSADSVVERDCPIQQGLADENPDVDAIYRLVSTLPLTFGKAPAVVLGEGSWCPFNSQNTAWWPEAFPLLYLPSHCSFRMTDIWRSFVAQRIAWANGWGILFHNATVYQERNEHNLMRDFADEVPGYLHNAEIARTLEGLTLDAGTDAIPENLRRCYRAIVDLGLIKAEELELLDLWLADIASLKGS